ncbi:MAG: AI-2E family transporter, partial [Planctomycetes bacterium]|nr:AI-2E family transporter [Planctomycetota bacterium]
FLMIFMLGEANGFSSKVARAVGEGEALERARQLKDRIASYLSIKTVISLVTGVLIGLFTMFMGLDSPALWGFVAFAFNFIPNIGSIIAAIPAVLMALIVNGWPNALGVAIGYAIVNTVIGSVVEPKVMGRKLGLSTLVVFLSLLFWSWVFGPIGMLLSVPLTVAVKILCEHVEDLRPVAVLLGPDDPDDVT